MNRIIQMIRFADKAHKGQLRKRGNIPFIEHPLWVAMRVARLENSTEDMILAALGHDLYEDTGVTKQQLFDLFGKAVADLVDELTNRYEAKEFGNRKVRKDLELERIKKISNEAKIIKMVDRLHNLISRGLDVGHMRKNYLPESKALLEVCRHANDELAEELADEIWRAEQEMD